MQTSLVSNEGQESCDMTSHTSIGQGTQMNASSVPPVTHMPVSVSCHAPVAASVAHTRRGE